MCLDTYSVMCINQKHVARSSEVRQYKKNCHMKLPWSFKFIHLNLLLQGGMTSFTTINFVPVCILYIHVYITHVSGGGL